LADIKFKEVGQGDSLIITWDEKQNPRIGIIDCNIYGTRNPIVEELQILKPLEIDFVIVSHMHADHFSGMPGLFEYCEDNNISIKHFYHTFDIEYLKIFSDILISQSSQKLAERFLIKFEKLTASMLIKSIDTISNSIRAITLDSGYYIDFLSPHGKDYLKFAEHQSRYLNGRTSVLPDFNSLSSVCLITNKIKAGLLTADTTKKPLRRLIGQVVEEIQFAQVPHHGSRKNHVEKFWRSLNVVKACPAIFSVGDVLRDKLPNIEVIEYFDKKGFRVESTDFTHGLVDYYQPSMVRSLNVTRISTSLSSFSTLVKTNNITVNTLQRFKGDKTYSLS
jgi:beta-lactamase superfamily II metal-dependent hydrolase